MKAKEIAEALDGIAAVNLSEPRPGDLERVYNEYKRTYKDLKAAEAKIRELETDIGAIAHKSAMQIGRIANLEVERDRAMGALREAYGAFETLKFFMQDTLSYSRGEVENFVRNKSNETLAKLESQFPELKK